MPNIFISGLPPATLPLDGPNSFFEVQTFEAGVAVSRKIAADDINIASAIIVEDEGVPLATGAQVLDFVGAGVTASGVGSTKTITIPMTGQVNSVVGGTNINVNAGDPINPVVNLDAAITGVSVNGVTLSNAGAIGDFLNEQGNYVAAGGADPSISEINNQDNDYTLVLADAGRTIRRTTNGFVETWTIPAEASVDYPIGTWIAFFNGFGADTSIALTTDIMRGTDGFTGTRTLGGWQRALVQKVASALWVYQATDL
jgi:hypothetical protein